MTCQDCGQPIGVKSRRPLCKLCYNRRRHNGNLDQVPKLGPRRPVRVCARCSLETIASSGLCRDCTVVTRDLGELGRWVA